MKAKQNKTGGVFHSAQDFISWNICSIKSYFRRNFFFPLAVQNSPKVSTLGFLRIFPGRVLSLQRLSITIFANSLSWHLPNGLLEKKGGRQRNGMTEGSSVYQKGAWSHRNQCTKVALICTGSQRRFGEIQWFHHHIHPLWPYIEHMPRNQDLNNQPAEMSCKRYSPKQPEGEKNHAREYSVSLLTGESLTIDTAGTW